MSARLYVPDPLVGGMSLELPAGAARHVQVLRLQPGDGLQLFDGRGGQWSAQVLAIGRRAVQVRVLEHQGVERELECAVTLALGMPANERMDTLIEKATELGVSTIQPLTCERSVLRVAGERAERKAAHWQAIAVAACEQCGRNRLPVIATPRALPQWLAALAAPAPAEQRLLLCAPAPDAAGAAVPLARLSQLGRAQRCLVLSGPEGGLSLAEQAAARQAGFAPLSLGPRVLRADTAPLAALVAIAWSRA